MLWFLWNFHLILGNVDLNCIRLLFMIYCWHFMRTFFQEIVVISSLFSLMNILRPTRPAAFAALDSPSGSRTTLGPMFSNLCPPFNPPCVPMFGAELMEICSGLILLFTIAAIWELCWLRECTDVYENFSMLHSRLRLLDLDASYWRNFLSWRTSPLVTADPITRTMLIEIVNWTWTRHEVKIELRNPHLKIPVSRSWPDTHISDASHMQSNAGAMQ